MTGTRVAFFGFDISESSQIKSIRSMIAAGYSVQSFTFRRDNMNAGFQPEWRDVCLGHQQNNALFKRVFSLPRAIFRLMRHRRELAQIDLIVARNLDMVLFGLVAQFIGNRRAKLIYQCLDIHSVFTNVGPKGAVARWLERICLARVDKLVVSSPRFLSAYFGPVQGYSGSSHLLENKIWWPDAPAQRPDARRSPGPLRLGWVGTLRCPQSLALLEAAATHFGDGLEVILRGVVHRHNLPGFDAVLRRCPNIHFEGPYAYPDGLCAAYQDLDLVWAQDLWQKGANSDWLLPNRIYEAAYFGCPCIAIKGTETGNRIAQDNLGFTVANTEADSLIKFLAETPKHVIEAKSAALLARSGTDFSLSPSDIHAMLAGSAGPQQQGVGDVAHS